MSTKKKTSAKKSSAKKSSEAEGTATAELTEAEILEMQDSMSSEWGEGAPRKAKAFWPSALRLAGTFREYKLGLAVVLAFGIVSTVLTVWAPSILGDAMDVIFDGFLGDGVEFGALGRLLLIVLGMYVIAALFDWLQGRLLNDVVMDIVYDLRERIEAKVNRLPLSYFDTRQRGDLLSRTTNDVDNVQTALQQAFASLVYAVLTIVGITVMMFWLSWQLALIALIALPISGVVIGIIGAKSQKLFTAQWRGTGRLNGHVEESFTGHDLVTVFDRQDSMREQFDTRNEELWEASFKAQFYSGMIMPIMQWVTYLGYVGIAVVGGLRIAAGQMSLGQVTAFIQYSREFNAPLGEVAGMANMLISGVASAERIFELLDAEEQEPDGQITARGPVGEDAAGPVGSTVDSAAVHAEASAPEGRIVPRQELTGPTRGRIEFDHVAFSYTPEKPLISDLSLTAEPGQTIAIVGPTGAGKTTLVNLIMRFYEIDAGEIRLDGVDIRALDRGAVRSRVGMVLQDAVLFGGTIRENIRYGRLDATDEEVVAAATATFVDRFVHTLPDGYDTVIEDEGANVSAGERQLITIARAFLADPALLILDEATSSVDTRTEVLVQEAMAALRTDRTSFVIAHRLSTIRDADVILVMEHGDIVEQGSHDALLAAGGAYHRLYWSQFADGVDPDEDEAVLEGTTTGPVPAVAATEGAAVPGEQGAAGAQ
ncbi:MULTISPECIES: ABC transporter ATP-binding protein [Brachybacterium]|uniref:ABC transporter ATP-binding protein n=1 Tax=Brachybacterium TaxID=43668 RepID=UPI0006B4BAF6|nr:MULTISPECIES: ABC transporter ATP-binding protein [Brachybacterium]GAP78979.1 lipid A export ATP-binding/permease protein MsbA [Brachybacterium sp. SW0106-09]